MMGPSLQSMDLIRPNGEPVSGLVPVRTQDGAKQGPLRVDEQATVLDAANLPEIDFILFRRFADGRSSQVAAYIVDNSDRRLNESALAALHWQLWLHGTAPLLYIAWPSRVDILTCARGPDFWQEGECQYSPAETLFTNSAQTAAQISAELEKRRRLSALRLIDGTFWEDPANERLADYSKAAHQSLIQAVVEADDELKPGCLAFCTASLVCLLSSHKTLIVVCPLSTREGDHFSFPPFPPLPHEIRAS